MQGQTGCAAGQRALKKREKVPSKNSGAPTDELLMHNIRSSGVPSREIIGISWRLTPVSAGAPLFSLHGTSPFFTALCPAVHPACPVHRLFSSRGLRVPSPSRNCKKLVFFPKHPQKIWTECPISVIIQALDIVALPCPYPGFSKRGGNRNPAEHQPEKSQNYFWSSFFKEDKIKWLER